MQDRIRTILSLGLPIIGTMFSQSLINLVDTLLVGQLGESALAAVGAGNYAIFVSFGLISGLSAAIQAQVARRRGEGVGNLLEPVCGGFLIALLFALPLCILLSLEAGNIMPVFQADHAVTEAAALYFAIRVLSLPAAVLNLSYRGFWNGIRESGAFFRLLLFTHLCNAIISYILIYGLLGFPPLGVAGAATGTLIAMYLGAILNHYFIRQRARQAELRFRLPSRQGFFRLIRLAIPDSAQQTCFALGMSLMFWLIARLGSEAMAVAHVLINISLVLILPGIGLGMASTTLVSHALGAGKQQEAWRWGLDVALLACAILALLSVPVLVFPELFLGPFLGSDETLVKLAVLPLQLAGVGIIIESFALVLTQSLLGAGANKTVLAIRFSTLWLFMLPGIWLVTHDGNASLTAVWCVLLLQKLLISTALLIIWQRRHWDQISI